MKQLYMIALTSLLSAGLLVAVDDQKGPVAPKASTSMPVVVQDTKKGGDVAYINGIATSSLFVALGKYGFLKAHKDSLEAMAFAFLAYAVAQPDKLARAYRSASKAGILTEQGLDFATSASLTVAIAAIISKVGLKTYRSHLRKA